MKLREEKIPVEVYAEQARVQTLGLNGHAGGAVAAEGVEHGDKGTSVSGVVGKELQSSLSQVTTYLHHQQKLPIRLDFDCLQVRIAYK